MYLKRRCESTHEQALEPFYRLFVCFLFQRLVPLQGGPHQDGPHVRHATLHPTPLTLNPPPPKKKMVENNLKARAGSRGQVPSVVYRAFLLVGIISFHFHSFTRCEKNGSARVLRFILPLCDVFLKARKSAGVNSVIPRPSYIFFHNNIDIALVKSSKSYYPPRPRWIFFSREKVDVSSILQYKTKHEKLYKVFL